MYLFKGRNHHLHFSKNVFSVVGLNSVYFILEFAMYITDRYHQVSKFQGNFGYLELNQVVFCSIETKRYNRVLI